MAVEVENTSQIDEFLRVLRRRFWWILVPAVLIATLGVSYAIIVPKKYVAATRLMVYNRPGAQARGGGNNTSEGLVAEHKIKAPQRVIEVLGKLQWPEYEELATASEQYEYRNELIKNIKVGTPVMNGSPGQQLVQVSFAHTNVDQAQDFLRSLVDNWKNEVLNVQVLELRAKYDKNSESIAELERERKDLSDQAADLRRDNDIPPPQARGPRDFGQRIPAFEEVDRLKLQVISLQEQIATETGVVDLKKATQQRMPDTLPVTAVNRSGGNAEVARLEQLIGQKRTELDKYAPSHSRYKILENEIESLQTKLDRERGLAPSEDVVEESVPNEAKLQRGAEIAVLEDQIRSRRNQLRDVAEALKEAQAKALALQTVYSTLDMLESDIAATNKSMADVRLEQERIKRQISLQDSPLGNPFDELELVQASDKPTEPNAWLLSAVSVLLGIGTGMGLALVLEYSKNCFRSINDIAQSMEVPVLGAVNKIETRKQRNMRHMRKVVMSVALALLVAVVSYTLYAWVLNPSLLTPSLVDSIDRLREALG